MTNSVRANADDQSHTHTRASARRDLFAVAALALVVRLAWIWFGGWVAGDSAWYLGVARNLVFNHLFGTGTAGANLAPTAFRPPLYSSLIAVFWFGDSAPIHAVLLVQALLGTATVALVYLIARDQFARPVALLAATGMAWAPLTGHFTAVILSETLFTFLLTFGVWCWGRQRSGVAGVALGLAALTRVTVLPFVVLLCLLTLFGPWRSARRGYLTMALVVLAFVSVWTVRNALQFHRLIPVAAGGYGTNLFLGSLETGVADDVGKRKALLSRVDEAGGRQTDESEFDHVRLRAALRSIADHPGHWLVARAQQYPRLFIDSGSYLFPNDTMPLRSAMREGFVGQALVRILFVLGNLLVFLFAFVELVAGGWRGFVRLSHLSLFPLFLMIISLPFWIEPRYGLPMMPLVAVGSAAGFVRAFAFVRARQKRAGAS